MLPQLLAAEIAAHRRSAMLSGGQVHPFGPLVAACAGRGTPLDTAWHDGHRAPSPTEWDAFELFCAAQHLPPTIKLLSPALPPLLPALNERGYRLDYLLHVYAHDLRELPAVPQGAEVTQAANADAWAKVAAAGFGAGTLDIMRAVGRAAGQRFWARAAAGAEPQATGAYTLLEDVAAFHGAATLPQARGQGLQAALLAARLQAAQAEGARWASVSVTPGSASERNVRRAGFRLAGTLLSWTGNGSAGAP